MSVIPKLATSLGKKDEVPNQLLAKEIAQSKDSAAVRELVDNLANKNVAIVNDCIKTIYEIGYIDPQLIAGYSDVFIRLLFSRNNRLVWGAMITLSVIASIVPQKIFESRDRIISAMREGSVITVDNGVKVLAYVAAARSDFEQELFPFLIDHLKRCRTKEVPQHAESIMVCVNGDNKEEFENVLKERITEMIPSQVVRIKRLLKQTRGF
jgi:hypothetical protein